MKIGAVVSDFAGVLVEDGLQKTLRHYAEKYDLPIERVWETNGMYLIPFQIGEITEAQYWRGILSELGIMEEMPHAPEQLREAHVLYDEMLEFFRSLRGKNKTGLLTNSPREWFEYFDEQLGLTQLFDVVVSSHVCGLRKPDPRIYNFALSELGVEAGETVFIDDQERNLGVARELRIVTVHFESPEQAIRELRRLGAEL